MDVFSTVAFDGIRYKLRNNALLEEFARTEDGYRGVVTRIDMQLDFVFWDASGKVVRVDREEVSREEPHQYDLIPTRKGKQL